MQNPGVLEEWKWMAPVWSHAGNVLRAIDIHEREEVEAPAFKALVRQAVALNRSGKLQPSKQAKS
jgi:hypothetical protein